MFGMNLKGVPFADDENGFWMAFAICLLSSALTYAIVWISSRKNA
jgi:Mg2+ and Co2+ transporter CorA